MKRLTFTVLAALLCLSLLLSACDGNGETSSSADKDPSEVISDPSLPESIDDSDSPSVPDDSSEGESSSDIESLPPEDISEPDVSVPDESKPENKPDSYDGLMPIPVDSVRAAKGYRIAYTKESALAATECITNRTIDITAIYDGSVTRFFDAVNGTYYHAVAGKYLYPCCEGTFLVGAIGNQNANYSITFSRDKDNSAVVTYTTNDHDGHGKEDVDAIYCASDEKIYLYNDALYRVDGDGAVACRYYSGASPLTAYNPHGYATDAIDYSAMGKYGIAKNGEIIVPFEYDLILSGQDGDCVGVYMTEKDGRTYYISSDGVVLTPDGFDCGSQPVKNRAWVFDGENGYMLEFN